MRLNLGCGDKRIPGWVNVDKVAACNPDEVRDLEVFPWPWSSDSVDKVLLSHVLEHLGAETEVYLNIIKELYRVCRNGAEITIAVPHPRHDHFLWDPTHVRAITPQGLEMFSQRSNRTWIAAGVANTPLGIYLGVDFEITGVKHSLSEVWSGRLQRKEITPSELEFAASTYNNVVTEYQITLKVIKPPSAGG